MQTVVTGLDKALGDVGYRWSTQSMEKEDKWSHRWYLSEPRRGSGEPWNHVVVGYWTTPETYGQTCDMRVDVYSDRWRAHGEFEWRTLFLLRDRALPALMPDAAVSVLDHPGLRTWTWEASDLAARFAPREALPLEVGLRIEAYERRWAAGRWWERAGAASWMAWKRTGGAHAYGTGMYFAYPPNWTAFVVFALAVVLGRKVVRSCNGRMIGLVGLTVVLLMPVKVPTFVGWIYMPHGYVQAFDFDPQYYLREPVFTLVAGLSTAGLAWLVLRLVRRWSRSGDSI